MRLIDQMKIAMAQIPLNDMGSRLDVIRSFTCNAGELIPIEWLETLPGDILQPSTQILLRTQPMIYPIMHEIYVKTYYFHQPLVQIWSGFYDFITGGENGADATVAPYMTSTAGTGYIKNTLPHYFCYPLGVAGAQHSALKMRAYANIYNFYFRNMDVQSKLTVSTANGADTTTSILLKNINWASDYFVGQYTPQRGGATYLPLGTSAPVTGTTINPDLSRKSNANYVKFYTAGVNTQPSNGSLTNVSGNAFMTTDNVNVSIDPNSSVYTQVNPNLMSLTANLASATSSSVQDFREAMQQQTIKEILQRVGGYYKSFLRGIFGVESDDDRLDMPEYLGSDTTKILISEVLQTSEDGTTPQGNLAGHGITGQNVTLIKPLQVKEHGLLIGITAIQPVSMYSSQGWEKMDLKTSRYDYFMPQMQGIGYTEVLNKEIYAEHSSPTDIFCYQPQYIEYMSRRNTVTGEFADLFKERTMRRTFSSDPSFNSTFVTCTPVTDCFAVPSEPAYSLSVKTTYRIAKRKVQTNPGTLGLQIQKGM